MAINPDAAPAGPSRRPSFRCGEPVEERPPHKTIGALPRKKVGAACLRRRFSREIHSILGGHGWMKADGCVTVILPLGKPYAVVANPPSTGITAPQTKPLARDARYSAIPAISSGDPMRFIGASSMA
jgi:hypothetical protein